MAGTYIQSSGSTRYNRDVFLAKVKTNGDTIWTKRYGLGIGTLSNPDQEGATSLIKTLDGGLIILGYSDYFAGNNWQVYIIKVDSNGILKWQKTYGGGNNDIAYSILETTDKGFIISGCTYSYGAGDRDGYLIKTDSLGNSQWQKTYGGVGNDGLIGVCRAIDGNYLLSGWYNYNLINSNYTKPRLIKIDNNGNIIWDKMFGGNKVSGYFLTAVQLSDSTIVTYGGINDTLGLPNAGILLKTNSLGDSLWAREYRRTVGQDDYFNGFNTTNDGGFIMAGQVNQNGTPSNTQDGWLIKTDCLGADSITHYFGNSCYNGSTTGIKEIVIDYDVPNLMDNFPNPFDDLTVIPYYLPDKVIAGEIVITDITGRVIQKYDLEKGAKNIIFNSSELGNGIYYYTMIVDGKTITTKKMVILK